MAVSVRLTSDEDFLIKKYADIHGVTVSELLRQSVLERIEDEYDLKSYYKSLAAYKADPVTYSLEEVERELLR